MKTKTLLSIAVIAALPFTANATRTLVETNTPAAVGEDGTVKRATANAPYATNEPTVADQTHIATTAYVKGAYNDAIAAVNRLADDKLSVQDLNDFENGAINPLRERIDALESADFGGQIVAAIDNVMAQVDPNFINAFDAIDGLSQDISNLSGTLGNKRVDIYTTWDTNATTQVELSTVRPAQGNN